MNKYCQICYNIRNWRLPSGNARHLELGDSYVAYHGFGHEEWLFNFEWLLSDYDADDNLKYRYGFLQPIGKYRSVYVGETFSILLYTVNSAQITKAVALLKDVYIPNDQELRWVLERTEKNGWLDLMRQQVRDLGLSDAPLINPRPSSIANIRFVPENTIFFDPMPILNPPHKTTRIHRYQPLDWDDGYQIATPPSSADLVFDYDRADEAPDRSEAERTRAGQSSVTYAPQHSIIQNRLRRALRTRYGMNSVKMERDFVDLQLVEPSGVTYIEIKMEKTAKSCIRIALGQIMEYAHYPNYRKADTLLIGVNP